MAIDYSKYASFPGEHPLEVEAKQSLPWLPKYQSYKQSSDTGDVLGASTGGSGGGSNNDSGDSGDSRDYEEREPDRPDVEEINRAFEPAMGAYNSYIGSLQSQLSGQSPLMGEQQLRNETTASQGMLQSARADKKQEFAGQRTREEGRTESAVSEARRQGNELLQGIQSRFGTTTGTGAFVGELTGRTVLQNIAQNRAALQTTMAQIADAEASVEREVSRQMQALDLNLKSAVQGLRDNLMKAIQDTNMQKGVLESQKANTKLDMLNQFRQEKANVEARNAAFRQELFQTAQAAKAKAQGLKSQATENYTAVIESMKTQGLVPSDATFNSSGTSNIRFAPEGQPEEKPLVNVSAGARLYNPNTQSFVGGGEDDQNDPFGVFASTPETLEEPEEED